VLTRVKSLLEKSPDGSLSLRDLKDALDVPADDRKDFRHLLQDAVERGVLEQVPPRRYRLKVEVPTVEGVVHRHERGFGWLTQTGAIGKANDPFIPPEQMEGLLHGDRVRARIEPGRGGKPKADIVQVLTKNPHVIGTVQRVGKHLHVVIDGLVEGLLLVDVADPHAIEGMAIEVEIVERSLPNRRGMAKVLRIVGKGGDLGVEVEKILSNAKVPIAFPADVLAQAENQPEDIPAQARLEAMRRDITHVPLVTIDGETAKDFDDAVHVRTEKGVDILTVAIADVSHYVSEGSPLDVEAARRGTSIYIPSRVIPMLPHMLSDDLCSLRPHQPRLCMVAEMHFERGEPVPTHVELYSGLMKSRARLTYNRVQEGIESALKELPEAPGFDIPSAVALYRRLKKYRMERGALDIDLPEQEIRLDENGEPSLVRAAPRFDAHMLIEEFMIAANEAVARWFQEHHVPSVYRIHEPPDAEKLERFRALSQVYARDVHLKKDPKPRELSLFLASLKAQPQAAALQQALLRSLMQAKYSTENAGHYGLASDAYLHFTSPIRRYPDLLVHRELRRALLETGGKKRRKRGPEDEGVIHPRAAPLHQLAEQNSQSERTATDIERAVDGLYSTRFCQKHLGETFDAVVTGVVEFGLFVTMQPINAEGLVPIQGLGDDYFELDKLGIRLTGSRTRRSYALGDALRVTIVEANLTRRQVTLALERTAASLAERPDKRARPKDAFDEGDSKPRGWPQRKTDGGRAQPQRSQAQRPEAGRGKKSSSSSARPEPSRGGKKGGGKRRGR